MTDYKETNNFILKTTFCKCLVPIPKMRLRSTPQKLNFVMANNNNNNFFILGKQIYNKIVAKIIKNNRIPKIKQTKYNIINRTKMLNRLVFHLTDQYRVKKVKKSYTRL